MKIRRTLLIVSPLSVAHHTTGQSATPAPSPPPLVLSYPYTLGISMFSIAQNAEVASPPFYAYGGEPLMLPVTVQAPLGTHLRIYADVSQWTGSIVAPWERNVPVSEEIVFGERTYASVACKLPTLRAVLRKTQVSVPLHTEPKMDGYPGGLSIHGFVYPREEPAAWRTARRAVRTICQLSAPGTWQRRTETRPGRPFA